MNRFHFTSQKVKNAINYLLTKNGKPPSFIQTPSDWKVLKGKLYFKKIKVIPLEEVPKFLREVVYGSNSLYPYGRDSLYHSLKSEVLGVSKRAILNFLNSQGPIVSRRSRPPQAQRENLRQIRKSALSCDLVHVRSQDFENLFPLEIHGEPSGREYMGAIPEDKNYQSDRYFLNCVDLLTSWLGTEVLEGKTPQEVASPLMRIIKRFEKESKQKVKRIEVDAGGEFKGLVSKMLKERGIRLVVKKTNALVEQANSKMQRIFFSLVEQRRGYFLPTVKMAVKIANRTLNRRIGMTPDEGVSVLSSGRALKHKAPKAGPQERRKALPPGTHVRILKKGRTKGDDLSFKSYKADHFTGVLKISKVRFVSVYPKYLVGTRWVWGDELITVNPQDKKSSQLIASRPVRIPGRAQQNKKKPQQKPQQKKPRFEIGDKVTFLSDGVWLDGVYDGPAEQKQFTHKVYWMEDGRRWVNEFKRSVVRKRE